MLWITKEVCLSGFLLFAMLAESEKGGLSLADLRRVAIANDFTWSEDELADMIHCFDSNGDGKVSCFVFLFSFEH